MKPIAALVFAETVRLCGSIEQQTQTERQLGGKYIRPIVVYQAEWLYFKSL